MVEVSIQNGQENNSISVIDRFGTALITCRNLLEILKLAGEAVHELLPEAMIYTSRVSFDGSYMQGTWQTGFDRYLKIVATIFGIDPFQKKFPVSGATAEELKCYRSGKLYHFEDGIYNLAIRTVPKPICHALEKVLNISAIYAIGFAWSDKHYGALVLMLPKGKVLKNAGAIETIVHLGSIAIQRVRAEDSIRQSEEKYRTLVEQSHEGIAISREGRIIFANKSFLKIAGYDSLDDLVKVSVMDLISPDSRSIVLAKREQAHLGEQEYDCKYIRKDGSIRDVNCKTSEIIFEGEKCIQGSVIDITDRKISEANRARISKLEALGTLSAGIAHEFNNLMAGIFGFIECAQCRIQDTVALDNIDKALSCMVRAKELTSRLLTFSKGGTPSLKCSPIFPFAEEVLKTAVNGAPIRCRIEAPETLWNCMYDEVQLRQVLHALTCNAVEAMPKGGELLLTAANVILDKTNRVYLSKGRYIQLTLADQGIGIPENELSHLFNPFFSTKPQGSGLNLAIAHSVLKRHGGSIAVESATGKGTKFHLYLKAAA